MNRRSRILLGTFAAMMAVVLLVSFWPRGKSGADLRVPGWAPGSKGEKGDEEAPFDSIEIALDGQSVVLSRDADRKWTLGAPAGARPDRYKVRQIVDLMRDDLVSVLPASAGPDDLKAFGLDAAGRVAVTFHRAGGGTTGLEIGLWQKPEGGTGEGDTFVRVAGDPRVWRVLGRNLRRPFEGGVKGLRDRKLLSFDVADVVAIGIRDAGAADPPDRDIRLVSDPVPASAPKEGETPKKPDRTWRFETPAGLVAGDVKTYLTSLAGIYVQEYADALPPGVAMPDDACTVRLELADGGAIGLRIVPGKEDSAWIQVDGTPGYGKVAKYVLEQVRKHTGDLRDRKLFGATRDAIRAVDLVDGDRRLSFERSGNAFRSLSPTGVHLGKSLVDGFLADIENLRADAFVARPALAGVQTGLDQPILTVAITTNDGGRKVLKVGADKGSGTRYVTVEGTGEVATLPAWALTRIRKSVDDLRNKTFFDFPLTALDRIEIAHPDQTVVLQRRKDGTSPDTAWKIVAPSEATDLKGDAVTSLAGTVAGFSAKAIATDAAARKAVAGTPEMTLTAILEGGARHVLKVFANKKDGDPYATAAGEPGFKDVVLVLNGWQVKNVQKRLAELKK